MAFDILGEKNLLARFAENYYRKLAVKFFFRSSAHTWLDTGSTAEQISLIPQDLRTADPSFTTEVYHGHFGLSGAVKITDGKSPFAVTAPNTSWEKELHGFGWLRHFNASQDSQSMAHAKGLIQDWIKNCSKKKSVAWKPEIVSRRVISWLCHIAPFLEDGDSVFYDNVMACLTQKIRFLSAYYKDIPDGQPKLTALIALNMAGLCVGGQDKLNEKYLQILNSELDRQILEDGGHISRNPWIPVDLMFDLLPLKQCFVSRDQEPPEALINALKRIPAMIRFMRLGDGYLARFNGMSATLPDMIATILSYDDHSNKLSGYTPSTAYSRIEMGQTIIIADTGSPPDLALSNAPNAGCLSFEMSSSTLPIIVNCGAPGPANQEWHLTSRTTPYHSTLSINKKSSAKLLKENMVHKYLGTSLLRGPKNVTVECSENPGESIINASHDGFASRYNSIYSRKLILSKFGEHVEGQEHLWPNEDTPSKQHRFPFALHFHLHPDVQPRFTEDRKSILLHLYNGETWKFSTQSLVPALEESLFFADYRGPRRSLQIVLRGVCNAKAKFIWTLEKIQYAEQENSPPPTPEHQVPSRMAQIKKKLIFTNLEQDEE